MLCMSCKRDVYYVCMYVVYVCPHISSESVLNRAKEFEDSNSCMPPRSYHGTLNKKYSKRSRFNAFNDLFCNEDAHV